MKNNQKLMLVSLCTAAFVLGGCATSPAPVEGPTEPGPDPAALGLTETELMLEAEEPEAAAPTAAKKKRKIKGNANNVLTVENDLVGFLKAMPRSRLWPSNLRERIARLRAAHYEAPTNGVRNPLPAMSALSHGYASALLRAADGQTNNIGQYDGGEEPTIDIHGLITGYNYNPFLRSGNLKVKTVTRIFHGKKRKKKKLVRTDTYIWEIDILETGFSEVPVSSDTNGDPIFKVPIGQDQQRIGDKGFNVKLWVGPKLDANGNAADDTGDLIRVKHVYLTRTNHVPRNQIPKDTPDYEGRLPDDHEVYQVSEDNCIDIMFKVADGEELPTDLPGLIRYRNRGDYNYCLGRCKNPALINTGE